MRRGVGGLMQCGAGECSGVGEKAMRQPERLFLLYNLRSAKGEPDAKREFLRLAVHYKNSGVQSIFSSC